MKSKENYDCFVHFDIPLTLEHEQELLRDAGFVIEKVRTNPDNATILTAREKAGVMD